MKPLDIRKISGKKFYEECIKNRAPYLTRAREAAELTKPSLYPKDGQEGNSYPNPYQSLGARGVNNLANKIVMTQLPPNNTFFKAKIPKSILAEMGKTPDEIKPAMGLIEQEVIEEMEESMLRSKLIYATELNLVGGSYIIKVPDEGEPIIYRLDQFGVRRDKQGNVLKMCIEECLRFSSLPEMLQNNFPKELDNDAVRNDEKDITIYTCIIRHGNKYVTFQTIENFTIPETRAEYPLDYCPYKFVPFIDRGGDFGRSYLEDYMGDLESLEGLRKSTLEASAEAARVIYLLSPNATISVKRLQEAKSGDVLTGSETDISLLNSNSKVTDLQITQAEVANLRQDLSSIFLLDSAVRRNAERVTAEEIRIVAQELEVAMGGVYSTQSKSQKELVKLYIKRCIDKGSIPKEFIGILKAEIITGVAALGRGSEFSSLNTFLTTLQNTIGPENYLSLINRRNIVNKLAYSLGLNPNEITMTEDELAQQQAQAQAANQQQLIDEAAAPVIAQQAMNGEQ